MKNIQKILLILLTVLFLPFLNIFSQDIIINKNGEIFSCKINTIENDSLYYTFELSGKTYPGNISTSEISYSGKDFIRGDTMINQDIDNYPDLIITKKGDIFFCKITDVSIYSIIYLFSSNGYQLQNEILKKYVAHFSKDYKSSFELEKESIVYFENILKDNIDSFRDITPEEMKAGHVEAKTEIDSSALKKDLIIKKTGQKLICKVDAIGINYVKYSFFMLDKIHKNYLDKDEVKYIINDYLVKSDTVFLEKEKVTVRDIVTDNDFNDLIIKKSGQKLTCKVDAIGISYVKYSFFMMGKVHNNYIDKNEVNYIIHDYLTKSDTVFLEEEKITVENIVQDYDFSDLIVTTNRDFLECSITHVGSNTIEFVFEENGTTHPGIIEKNEIIYYGKDFVENIDEPEKLKNDTYKDLIYTNNNNTLLCNIENVSKSTIEYSFLINNIKLSNTIERKDIIYFGINFFNDPQVEETQVEEPQVTVDTKKKKKPKRIQRSKNTLTMSHPK